MGTRQGDRVQPRQWADHLTQPVDFVPQYQNDFLMISNPVNC